MARLISRYKKTVIALLGALGFILLFAGSASADTYNAADLVSDDVFTNYHSMSVSDIQTFLVNEGSYLATYSAVEDCGPTSSSHYTYYEQFYHCGSSEPASQIIYDASQAYEINPQAIMATMQKEQSLITDPDPTQANLDCAMGYLSCNGDLGFFYQVDNATWQFRYDLEGTEYASSWNGWTDMNSWYASVCGTGGPNNGTYLYSNGLYGGNTVTFYDPGGTAETETLATNSTAVLYCYTPYVGPYWVTGYSGSYNFVISFEEWWGSTVFSPNSVTMTNITQADPTPAVGQTATYTYSLTNNLSDPITINAVGLVGRVGNVDGPNCDFGWQGPVTINAGQTEDFTFSENIANLGSIFVWPSFLYEGQYIQFNNWGEELTTHLPDLSVTTQLSSTNSNPVAGQNGTLSATITNKENYPIQVSSLGIPVRYYGTYNYDAAWTSPFTIAPDSTQTVSGTVTFDKPGPYTAWLSAYINGMYITLSPNLNINASTPVPNFALSYSETPDTTPAIGENVTVQYSLTNNSGVPMTLSAVGLVGRYSNPYTGANDDFGWQGPVTFSAGQTQTFTFSSTISQLTTLYAWPALLYNGSYTQYNPWGFMLKPHSPNLTISSPITINGGNPPQLNQETSVSVTIQNNESVPINYSAIGIPIRYYGQYNYDAVWDGPGTLAPSGQSGSSITLNGTVDFNKSGPYTVWASIDIKGTYITIGSPVNVNL